MYALGLYVVIFSQFVVNPFQAGAVLHYCRIMVNGYRFGNEAEEEGEISLPSLESSSIVVTSCSF